MSGQPIEIWIDEDIADLIPGYLERREEDLVTISAAFQQGDFEKIQNIGHSLKGSGGGYGLQMISVIGRHLEESAALEDIDCIQLCRYQLQHYLNNLVIFIKPCVR